MFRVARGSGSTEIIAARGRMHPYRNSESQIGSLEVGEVARPVEIGGRMSTYRLDKRPRSVAVVGASPRRTSLGLCWCSPTFSALVSPARSISPQSPLRCDRGSACGQILLTICLAPRPGGNRAAADGSVGRCRGSGKRHGSRDHHHGGARPPCLGSLAELCVKNARARHAPRRPQLLRLCRVPQIALNASFASAPPLGDLALISQSGALATGSWSGPRSGASASAIVSIGDSIDVYFADALDFFAMDRRTRAIFLYVESIKLRPEVHVGGARRGARQAGAGDQIRMHTLRAKS